MDFQRLVETEPAYSENNLKEKDKEFVAGMRWVLEQTVENFPANYCIFDSENTLEKIKSEIVTEAVEELKMYIKGEIAEMIVSILDGYEDDEA